MVNSVSDPDLLNADPGILLNMMQAADKSGSKPRFLATKIFHKVFCSENFLDRKTSYVSF